MIRPEMIQVVKDIELAAEHDRAKSFEAGRLHERENAFEAIQEAYKKGVADERAALVTTLKARICFNFAEGKCDHGACYAFNDLARELNK